MKFNDTSLSAWKHFFYVAVFFILSCDGMLQSHLAEFATSYFMVTVFLQFVGRFWGKLSNSICSV